MLPKPGQKVHYETNQELYWHIGEDDVSLSHSRDADTRYPSHGGCLGCSGIKVPGGIIIEYGLGHYITCHLSEVD